MKKNKKNNKIKKFVQKTFFIFGMIFLLIVFSTGAKKAEAAFFHDALDFPSDIWTQITNLWTQVSTDAMKALSYKEWYKKVYDDYMLPILKKAAIKMVNGKVSMVLEAGNNGKPFIVTDWNEYLNVNPTREANTYVNSLLTNSLAGRDSSSYSNSNYYSYLRKQAEETISPLGIEMKIDSSGDVKAGMFLEGNLKTWSQFLEPGKNPYSVTAMTEKKMAEEVAKNKQIAQAQQTNGFLPKKSENGTVLTPAALLEESASGLVTNVNGLIVNATKPAEIVAGVITEFLGDAMENLEVGLVIES